METTANSTLQTAEEKTEEKVEETKEITCVIEEHLGVLSTNKWGWSKEVNLVSWNNRPGKLDIRGWNADHSKRDKGVTLNSAEIATLTEILNNFDIASVGI